MLVVAELYPKWRELQIHESSPGGPLSAITSDVFENLPDVVPAVRESLRSAKTLLTNDR